MVHLPSISILQLGDGGFFLAKKRGTFYMLARAFPQIAFGENGNFTLD